MDGLANHVDRALACLDEHHPEVLTHHPEHDEEKPEEQGDEAGEGTEPGERHAEEEGLDKIFIEAGFEWREPGCSMCLAMNADRLEPGERCAATSNRNFEGRQGYGGRTHLVSPAMAAAAAVAGHFVDPNQL